MRKALSTKKTFILANDNEHFTKLFSCYNTYLSMFRSSSDVLAKYKSTKEWLEFFKIYIQITGV